ncbi:Alpha/beta hydrolase domain-containing protein 17C [Trichinella britovi]|uniref:Alpha/beta hydrolase domain-containing protein 17C n=1 Tax=Trichinella britovi TaxID=45882 RepID=A0A0V1DF17_TRIBR|nr:Alpha/beta hydrolase domain-containing protein 17C [Trichinella britovi]
MLQAMRSSIRPKHINQASFDTVMGELCEICWREKDRYRRKRMVRFEEFLAQLHCICPPFPNIAIRKIAYNPPKPNLVQFWNLDGFDPNKILPQSVCYLLKEETDVACVHVKNPLQQPSEKDNVVDLENLCTYVGLPSSTLYKIADILNLDVISYDYSSYGISTGKLSEKHHYRSIQLLYNFMSNKLGIDDQRIIIRGKSLGTIPFVQFLPTVNCNFVILQSSILSDYRCVFPN